ncbi:hypothetical protein ACFWNN_02180 [Lentzea sp. NPDC058450]|uniref:hypothetical protein n=1 Tax=Lentzea sp. NPDC058450 TaxID=3346505 RepID=UPI0036497124
MRRPASAVSTLTAVGLSVPLVIGLIGVVLGWVPWYISLWCAALAVTIGLNLWAGRGGGE